jgi:ABC-type transporter Mla MlaB component
MLRIDERVHENGRLKLEGRIVGPWTDEARVVCEQALAACADVTLDLAGVEFVDRPAAALLVELRARGARLVNASPFLIELLRHDR